MNFDDDIYEPVSDFLKAVAAGNAPLSGNEFAEANFRMLIEMTRDQDRSNRDWATFLLAMQEIDTPEVRNALLLASGDKDLNVRAEAILGLAQRDHDLVLPLVHAALAEMESVPVCEAAALLAHPSLIDALRRSIEEASDSWFKNVASEALVACETGIPRRFWG
jgi:HEAT repeat protein